MNYYTTAAAAHLARVSPRQLRHWREAKLILYPPMLRVMTARGKWVRIYYWSKLDIDPLLAFAKTWRNRKRQARRRMPAELKRRRQELRRGLRATERLLSTARWFERNPLCDRIFTSWSEAEKELKAAGLLDSQSRSARLAQGAIAGLESKLAELREQYLRLPGRHDGIKVPKV